jgi:uncharacterized membrane protein
MTFEKGFGIMLFARARRREERGAILILSVVGMVLAMIAAGLAIDIGRIAQAARDDQRVADLAALDAARVLPADYAVAARASADRNGFPANGGGYSVTAIEGVKTNNQCVASVGAGSVCVTVTSPHTNAFPFIAGRDTVTRTAVAGAGAAIGTVKVGSSLASVSGTLPPMEVLMLNKVMSALTGGTYNINAVGWRGLADSTVTFSALTQALGGVTGNSAFTLGSTNEVLNTTFTMNQLLTAAANVLNNNGNSSVATNVLNIRNGINTTATYLSVPLKLYDFFDFGSIVLGNKQDVANMTLNVLDLIRGGAVLADGDHFASFNLAAADVIGGAIPGGFTNAKISMGLIEAPQMAFGPAGKDGTGTYYTGAHTSQIRVKIDVTVRVPLTGALTGLLGVVLVPAGTLVDATFSYYLNAGNAHAYLDAIRCGTTSTPTGVDIWGVTDVGTSRFGLVSDTDLRTESTIPVPAPDQTVLSILGIVNVKATGLVTTNIPGNSGIMRTFTPPFTDTSASQTVPGTMLSLPSLANTSLTTQALVLNLNTGTLITDLISGINSTGLTFNSSAPGVTTTILKPLYDAIGLSFGTADLWAPPVQTCSALSSLGSVTSTNPPVLRG